MNPEVERMASAYRTVAPSMEGLAVFNPRLTVEAVGFREWDRGRWLGVMITPWFMNLVLLPGPGDDWAAREPGARQSWTLPDGDYDFTLAGTGEVPVHQSCALFTTVTGFPDMESARAVAHQVLVALFTPPPADAPAAERPPQETGVQRALTRRDLLRRAVGAPGDSPPRGSGQ